MGEIKNVEGFGREFNGKYNPKSRDVNWDEILKRISILKTDFALRRCGMCKFGSQGPFLEASFVTFLPADSHKEVLVLAVHNPQVLASVAQVT
jgi:hypothetical protein